MKTSKGSLLAAALSYASIAHGSAVSYCPSNANNVCFAVAIPTSTASTGSGNIYFQISAPSSYQWVSLGTGTQMSNSNLFIMYQDGSGNLTLSPRKGTFHTMPSLDTSSGAARLTLLDGSGVTSDGTMVANVKCANCESWSGGKLSVAGTASWVGAWKQGSSLSTTSRSASLQQHDDTTTFNLDLTQATVSEDSNPFTGTIADGGVAGGGGSGDSGGVTVVAANKINAAVLAAHGVIMGLVFAALYPLGSLLMPLLGKWWLHAAWQGITFILMWVGFGMGVKAASERSLLYNNGHTVFGTVIVCLLAVQPVLGVVHHKHFVSTGGRGTVSYIHIWFGRVLLVLGVVNGGVGLNMAMERSSLIIAYSVVAAVTFLAWFIAKAAKSFGGRNKGSGHKEIGSPREIELPRRPYRETRGERAPRYV